jgi:hypothetical protein
MLLKAIFITTETWSGTGIGADFIQAARTLWMTFSSGGTLRATLESERNFAIELSE